MSDGYPLQDQNLIYALDIGTRSIIGILGRAVEDKLEVLAIEKQEHSKRTMLDGQIEDIAQVAKVVRTVTAQLEDRMQVRLKNVCIAAAGRALHTQNGHFELSLPATRRINHDLISELEAGAVSAAEEKLSAQGEGGARFYLVGYTVSQYRLDRYPLSTLLDHSGQLLEAEVVATFLPGEVVESLYATMRLADLDVVSLTLEPIAALNAAIPAEIRLLNLVLADIGAGTTDIAICREGSVVGYTMATIAGDEISEAIMKAYLVDFKTAERLKVEFSTCEALSFTDVLGVSQEISAEELSAEIKDAIKSLAQELSRRILEINGGTPSALFLSGGGSKLSGLREQVAENLDMDVKRVAVAGNNFHMSSFSEAYDLNDPEYATPLGIAVSAGLGLLNDSYRVTLNDQPAKLFRNGTLSALDILMMNGYGYADLIGRAGRTLSITVDGERVLFRGELATPCQLLINGKEMPPSTIIHSGDHLQFTPAKSGASARKTFADLVGSAQKTALLNGASSPGHQLIASGDIIITGNKTEPEAVPTLAPAVVSVPQPASDEPKLPSIKRVAPPRGIRLNGAPLALKDKPDGSAYYLMDMLEHSGIDFTNLEQNVLIQVNNADAPFTYALRDGDSVTITLEAMA